MSYIEITIWNLFRRGHFTWRPKFERWPSKDGFDAEWLFVSISVSNWNGDDPSDELFKTFMSGFDEDMRP